LGKSGPTKEGIISTLDKNWKKKAHELIIKHQHERKRLKGKSLGNELLTQTVEGVRDINDGERGG